MNRGILEENGKAVLWHNFYGSEKTKEEDIVRDFEENSKLLKERSNGNILYHEILSFSRGHQVKEEALLRIIADIGQEYLSERASRQMAYGVVHRDTDHIHLHLMVSSNAVGRTARVRLSKKEFAEVQKRVERFALERYPELAQTKIYDRPRAPERLKTDVREQAMKARSPKPSQKEILKGRLHGLFERARSFQELAELAQAEGLAFYQRGKTVGVSVRDQDGQERKHRLSTLGVEPHYLATNERLLALDKSRVPPKSQATKEKPMAPGNAPQDRPSTSAPGGPHKSALDREIEDLLSKVPGVPREPMQEAPKPAERELTLPPETVSLAE